MAEDFYRRAGLAPRLKDETHTARKGWGKSVIRGAGFVPPRFSFLEIGGRRIRQGQVVHLVLAAANRDPAHFSEPDRLDVGRSPNKHLAFAQGIHYCLGAPPARLEGQIAL